MPWKDSKPAVTNNKTLKAQKLDRRAARQVARVDPASAAETRAKADKAALRGGWL